MEAASILFELLVIALIIIIILSIGVYQKSTNAVCLSRRRLEGKTVIVTGGTMGMGLVIATDLAHRGARVIVACPFENEGINARNKIIMETGNEKVIFKYLDLGSFKSIRKFSTDILETEERLDILINNAGIGFPPDFLTKDGLSFIMQVNYYGTFLLTLLLLPILKTTGKLGEPSRILTTTSFSHMFVRVDIQKDNNTNHVHWYSIVTYAKSKLYLIYFANELTKSLKGSNIVINNVDPGAVGTRIFDSLNISVGTIVTVGCLLLFKTPWYGAQTALHAALDGKAGEVSGEYFKNCEIKRAAKHAYCDKTAIALWEDSIRRVKLTDGELDKCFK